MIDGTSARPRVRALCCNCGAIRTTTTIGGLGEPWDDGEGLRCLVSRKCAVCGVRTDHAYLREDDDRDACEKRQRHADDRPDTGKCDYPGCSQPPGGTLGLAFCPDHFATHLLMYESGARHEFPPGEPVEADLLPRVYVRVEELPAACRPAWVVRRRGVTLVYAHPSALRVEVAAWASDHLTEAERLAVRDGFGLPLDLSVPFADSLLDGTMADMPIPNWLRLPKHRDDT